MAEEKVWDDQARSDLRETLRDAVLGQLRLASRGHQQILEYCEDVYLREECPQQEQAALRQFVVDEVNRSAALLAREMLTWPEETDCERLDRVENVLRERGILLWQVSPCCDTCTCGELMDRIEVINSRYPGFRDSARGFAFFIDQCMAETLAAGSEISLYLGYGWLSPDDSDVDLAAYEVSSLAIAREVCECLREEGFEVDWNGSFSRKIGITVDWLRRTLLA